MTRRKLVLGVVAVLVAVALAVVILKRGSHDADDDDEEGLEARHRISTQSGEIVVHLEQDEQDRIQLRTAAVVAGTERAPIEAYALVVDLKDIAAVNEKHQQARAELKRAEAALNASQREYERLRRLHADDNNVSAKAVEQAEAAFRGDQAAVLSATTSLAASTSVAHQDWGRTVGQWILEGGPAYRRLVERREVLVQVTVPADAPIDAPPAVCTIVFRGARVPARLASTATRVDARVLGRSFYYVADAASGLLPGMTLPAEMPGGNAVSGTVIPSAALVWWQGQAWVYVPTTATTFARRLVPTGVAAPGGYLVPQFAGTAVVTQGAALLLSEEFRSQLQAEDE